MMIPKRIETLKTMEELSVYACAKVRGSKDWATKCLDCGKCPVGIRVEKLLDAETAPDEEKLKTLNVEERCVEALKHEDPASWLVEHGYYVNRRSASDRIRRYRQKHGITEPLPDKQINCNAEKARKEVEDLFGGITDVNEAVDRFLKRQKPHVSVGNLFSKPYKWMQVYPDLAEKYPVMKEAAKILSRIGKENKNLTVAEYLKTLQGEAIEDDEVSIEDFLDEHVQDEAVTPPKHEELPKPVSIPASSAQLVLRDEFSKKRRSIRERIEKLKEAKQLIDDEMAELQNKLNMLDQTAELFGMQAIKTIRCSA